MGEIQQRLTRANRLAYLESLIASFSQSEQAIIPRDDRQWLLDLLAPIAAERKELACSRQRESQNLLFEILSKEYSHRESALKKELQRIDKLFDFISRHENQALDHKNREALVQIAKLLRQALLRSTYLPKSR